MQRVISATEARVHFGDLLHRVIEGHETVLVERGGHPQVVVLSVTEYERLLSQRASEGWRDRAAAARRTLFIATAERACSVSHRPISSSTRRFRSQCDCIRAPNYIEGHSGLQLILPCRQRTTLTTWLWPSKWARSSGQRMAGWRSNPPTDRQWCAFWAATGLEGLSFTNPGG
jgi:prevent-host-death family protein